MAAPQALIEHVDQVIAYFNTRRMDLPDGFFDRKAQFLVNGATFDSFLSTAPNDPLIMMLARGAAGYRFIAKALQHAVPDAKLERPSTPSSQQLETTSLRTPLGIATINLRLTGTLRGSNESVNALVNVTMRLTSAGSIESAEAVIDPVEVDKIRKARVTS